MNLTNKARNLLCAEFTHNGNVSCSAVHTCTGTMPLWGQLALAGLVKPMNGIGLGHPFSYELTDAGREFLGGCFSPYDHPYFCRVCRNTFSKPELLSEHFNRKHGHLGIIA